MAGAKLLFDTHVQEEPPLGKSAPTPPPAPDPTTLIDAQSAANNASAVDQATLNNVNYSGPQGTVTYNRDPATNQFTQNVTLNPTEQAAEDAYQYDQRLGANIAGDQLDAVRGALNQPLGQPTLQTGAAPGALQTGYDPGGQLAYGYNPGGAIQGQVAPTYSPFGGAGGAYGQGGYAPQGQAQPAAASSSAVPDAAGFMRHDDSSGNIPVVNDGIDPTGGHPGQMYDFSQGWIPATSAAVSPSQPGAASSGAPQVPPASYGYGQGAGQANPLASLLSNPVLGTQAATYAQATQALDPQWRQAAEQQQAQLVAQGLNPNDAAYQNAMQIFGNQENQAYNSALYSAIGAGDSEQNTLYGQNLSSGQFANAAQAQQYGENQGQAQFANAAQAQANSQNAAAAAFQNQALGQGWQEQYQNAQLANSAAQQQFQNQAYANQLPINDFNALMSSSQVGLPPSAPAQNTPVQPANVLGAYGLQQSALQNDYDAQMQNYQSGLGGLLSLGQAVIGKTSGLPIP